MWIARNPVSEHVLELARKVAETSTTVLITGESGTGKDQLARLIHELGPRRDAPYLKIDCASLPLELVESELFGHERGAFTGAVERKMGRLEMADSGTIVLDEVAALSTGIQSKLLRVLEERRFERLGGTETLSIEARLIALTNADLQRAVAARRFPRRSLFPAERAGDSRAGAARATPGYRAAGGTYAGAAGGGPRGAKERRLSDAARHALENYNWPGNIRELKNAIERGLIFGNAATLTPEDLPESIRTADSGELGSLRSLEEIEHEAIEKTLEGTHYKITQAAEILGISRKTLLDKRKKYGLQ